ncbi:hypothetical protein NIE88_21940 [Sporolactobacillus shoreicorticis]|uniref:Uncharacterized protein n=1 Tax=Sporolactobacillus shoreicorticis TaxID=1923877 RepID=A0ABW5S6Q6_9BACL|nr:hypothetical protein [Sporolactobacillus shoreicorticis]MCO7128386.1 hypothetical protein [Sporolactobacillus shoreicorticis]
MNRITENDNNYDVKPTVKIERSIDTRVDGRKFRLPFDQTVSNAHIIATANFLQNTPTGNSVIRAVDSIAKVAGKVAKAYAESATSITKSLRR